MDAVVSRIIEIERESALYLEQAEVASQKKIEAHRLALDEEQERTRAGIISEENNRFSKTILEAKKQTEAASVAFLKHSEQPFHDPVIIQTIQEDILSVLLEG